MMNIENPRRFIKAIEIFSREANFQSLIYDVLSVSSMDRPEECAEHILRGPSQCLTGNPVLHKAPETLTQRELLLGYHLQRRCGCAGGTPCYWGSADSPNKDSVDHITFRLNATFSLISSFSITAYQSFFQPNAPVFAPMRVALQFLLPSKNAPLEYSYGYVEKRESGSFPHKYHSGLDESALSENVYYTTPFFEMQNNALEQSFQLPFPVFSVGGVIRVLLEGKHQRQPIEGNEDFYCCISNVDIRGITFPDFTLQLSSSYTFSNLTEERRCALVYRPENKKKQVKKEPPKPASQKPLGGLWGIFS
jgi:hypothetical protein